MVVLNHPTGNANVRAVAFALASVNLLTKFHTAIATFPGGLLDILGGFEPFSEIRRRRLESILKPFTQMWPWRELGRLAASKAGFSTLTNHETGSFSIDAVYQSCDRHVAAGLRQAVKRGASAVYAYEDGALFTFRQAKQLGLTCYYDLPIGYWRTARRLLENERERWPEWASTLTGFRDSDEKLARKDNELELADRIFVASQFTASTLRDFPGPLAPVSIIPYGFPPVHIERSYPTLTNGRPLRLLFVGGLSQRKGIANLFAAVESFKSHVELTIVGRKASADCPALDTALSKHHWIPSLAHCQVLQLMREHDVFVFPSLFEGFGLVITEAMSQGTPVITTDRTAGLDLITHGKNGWLIEAGSTQALQIMIEELLRKPEQVALAGHAAMETARLRPWSVYGHELVKAIAGSKEI